MKKKMCAMPFFKTAAAAALTLLLAVLLTGCFNVDIRIPPGEEPAATDAPAADAVPPDGPAETTAAPSGEETGAGNTELLSMSAEEQLSYFNIAVNKIKASRAGFTKTKTTATKDIVLSNSLANSLVSLVKGALLSEDAAVTTVRKGEPSDAVMSPYNVPYVSQLTVDDVEGIDVQPSGGGYVITVRVRGETNPEAAGSICSRVFEFITVDDVVNTYAPKVNAQVERENIQVVFDGCYARATVDGSGDVTAYETFVQGTMKLKDARISVISTDVEVVLVSTTEYTGFQY